MFLGQMDTRLFGLLEKVKVLDAKEQQLTLTHNDRIERFKLKKELAMMRNWKDIFWRQRAKQQWMQQGDRNTKFFHRVANNKRKFNAIRNIKVNGQVFGDVVSMKNAIVHFYENLLHDNHAQRPFLDGISCDTH